MGNRDEHIYGELTAQMRHDLLQQEEVIQGATSIFDALSDSTRFQILCALLDKPQTITELLDVVEVSQSAISHQLRLLRDRGLVSRMREGKYVIYSLSDAHVASLINIALTHASEPYERG